jgi:putative peptidoglycan lipid II flippase
VAGSLVQLLVQLPAVLRVAPDLRASFDSSNRHVRTIGRNFLPALASRGVVQISGYIDSLLASLLPTGAVTGLANAQVLYTLPVSLFGMSVAASELPVMSGAAALSEAAAEGVRSRLDPGLRRIAFFVVPSSVAFLALGDVIAGTVLQTGRFTSADADYVWAILAGSAVGLVASTLARLYSATLFALQDTRTPLRFAFTRLVLTTGLGYLCAIPGPRLLDVDPSWGAAGLTLSAGVAGWVEMWLLRRAVRARVASVGMPRSFLLTLWSVAIVAAGVASALRWPTSAWHPVAQGGVVLLAYGFVYLGVTRIVGIREATQLARRAAVWRR